MLVRRACVRWCDYARLQTSVGRTVAGAEQITTRSDREPNCQDKAGLKVATQSDVSCSSWRREPLVGEHEALIALLAEQALARAGRASAGRTRVAVRPDRRVSSPWQRGSNRASWRTEHVMDKTSDALKAGRASVVELCVT